MALKELDLHKAFRYNNEINQLVPATSPFREWTEQTRDVASAGNRSSFESLCRDYAPQIDVQSVVDSVKDQLTAVRNRYPLLCSLKDYDINSVAVAQYINLIDKEV